MPDRAEVEHTHQSFVANTLAGLGGLGGAALAAVSLARFGIDLKHTEFLHMVGDFGGMAAGAGAAVLAGNRLFPNSERVGNRTERTRNGSWASIVIGTPIFAVATFGGSGSATPNLAPPDNTEASVSTNTPGDTILDTAPQDAIIEIGDGSGPSPEGHCVVNGLEFDTIPSHNDSDPVVQAVKDVQTMLTEKGLYHKKIDGSAPAHGFTSQAVDDLQQAIIDSHLPGSELVHTENPWDKFTCAFTKFWQEQAGQPVTGQ